MELSSIYMRKYLIDREAGSTFAYGVWRIEDRTPALFAREVMR
jgi:hypothetical protein